jgi:hypothetical protein
VPWIAVKNFYHRHGDVVMKLYSIQRSVPPKDKGLTRFFNFFTFLFFAILLIFPYQEGHCAQIALTWDPNSESDLAGYDIYYGTSSGNYQWTIDVGNITSYTLTGLNRGTTYYFAATAYNTQGLQSGFSNEVVYTVPLCTYTISPSSASFPASGGSGSVLVTTQADCNWGSSTSASWVTINSGTGMGSGTMRYTVSPNTGTSRLASLTIAGNVFSVTETGLSTYTITASAGSGGSISPSGPVSVLAGAGQTFTINPNTGYRIANVTIDGVSQGSISSYTFSSVSANHTITASFTLISSTTYKLSVIKNGTGDGTVSSNPAGTTFPAGTGVTLYAAPDPNSVFSGWSGACSGTTATCQVTMNSNLSVNASFFVVLNPPIVATDPATAVTLSSATLNGTVNSNGLSTTYFFQWGLTTSYGNATVVESAGSGTSTVPVSANITGLTPNTIYHYRVVAANSAGTTNGLDGTFTTQIARNDFNGDGKTDILWENKATGEVQMWEMNGPTIISNSALPALSDLNWEIKGAGDFNGEGFADILWENKVTGEVRMWMMNGPTVIANSALPTVSDLNWEIKGIGDFNGEGFADILWENKATGEVRMWMMNGPTVISNSALPTVSDLNWEIKGIGDFNGEGFADILWKNKATGEVRMWMMNGLNIISNSALPTVSDLNWEVKGVGDFDRDGKEDILWENKASGEVRMWMMNGPIIISNSALPTVSDLNWAIKGVGDFDGDGKMDILWRHNPSGTLYLWLMNGPTCVSMGSPGTVGDSNWTIVVP